MVTQEFGGGERTALLGRRPMTWWAHSGAITDATDYEKPTAGQAPGTLGVHDQRQSC